MRIYPVEGRLSNSYIIEEDNWFFVVDVALRGEKYVIGYIHDVLGELVNKFVSLSVPMTITITAGASMRRRVSAERMWRCLMHLTSWLESCGTILSALFIVL